MQPWLAFSSLCTLALVLPVCAMVFPSALHESLLLALESLWTLVALSFVVMRAPKTAPRLTWVYTLVALWLGDTLYNTLPELAERYPHNYAADVCFVGVSFCLVRLCFGPVFSCERSGPPFVVFLMALLALYLQGRWIVAPLIYAGHTPPGAIFLAWLYALGTAVLFGLVVLQSMTLPDPTHVAATLGLLLMFSSDFVQRYDASQQVVWIAVGPGEVGWTAGSNLMAAALIHALQHKELLWNRPLAVAPWLSARVVVGFAGLMGSALWVGIGLAAGLIAVVDGTDLRFLVWLVWGGLVVSNISALTLSLALNQLVSLLSEQNKMRSHMVSPSVPALLLPVLSQPLFSELDALSQRYNELVARLNPALGARYAYDDAVVLGSLATRLAHDIRSPLAAVQTAVDAMAHPRTMGRLKYSKNHWIQPLGAAVQRLEALAADLLCQTAQRSRALETLVASPPYRASTCSFDLWSTGRAAFDEIKLRYANQSNLRFMWQCDEKLRPTAVGNAELCHGFVVNVLNNAVEALGSRAGTVVCQLGISTSWCDLVVTDDGPGLKKDHWRFLGKQKVLSTKQSGTGIGLWLAAQSLRRWGGDLLFSSLNPHGLEVRLRFVLCDPTKNRRFILIDDDPLLGAAWCEAARQSCVALDIVQNQNELMTLLASVHQDTSFYIDGDLGQGRRGEPIAQLLRRRGFSRVYLFAQLPSKAPPF